MYQVLGELRRAREERGITLQEIAQRTLINVVYLEAIDRGTLDVMPEPYMRAFIREYAQAVGLDPSAFMERFDARAEAHRASAAPEETLPPPSPSLAHRLSDAHAWWNLPAARVALGALGVAMLALVIWMLLPTETPEVIRETPFDRVITETERRVTPLAPDRTATSGVGRADSLTLQGTFRDTVWIRVVADTTTREHLVPGGMRMSWKAREQFLITIGNAGGAEFTLNGKSLGALGRPGAVLRNVRIARDGVTVPPQAPPQSPPPRSAPVL
jgi:transcriptional regulator with XRE-family HTH domain